MAIGIGTGMMAGGLTSMISDIASSAMTGFYNAREAKKARRWARDMYSKRYQMTMADMAKAGLNPILAYQQGAGSVPSAAQASFGGVTGSGARAIQAVESGGRAALRYSQRQALKRAPELANDLTAAGTRDVQSKIHERDLHREAFRAEIPAHLANAREAAESVRLENQERRLRDHWLRSDEGQYYFRMEQRNRALSPLAAGVGALGGLGLGAFRTFGGRGLRRLPRRVPKTVRESWNQRRGY